MAVEFFVGMTLAMGWPDPDDETGTITDMTDDQIFIESDSFKGWATKKEISEAIELGRKLYGDRK